MGAVYKNRMIINQRGGSIDIDNTTEQEKIKISHRSGSNINLTNVVTSELATNNKQTNVVNDFFETVNGDKSEYYKKNYTQRIGENSFIMKGFVDQNELNAFSTWKDTYTPIAKLNGQFKIQRGGYGYPNGDGTNIVGSRSPNPVLKSTVFTLNNNFSLYSGTPIRNSFTDDVSTYSKVPDRNKTKAASVRTISKGDITQAAGKQGSKSPGVIEFGADVSPATEQGVWEANNINIEQSILNVQSELLQIEQQMGDGGDEILLTKRNKFEQVGAAFNDYPSIRIDEKGRSQPLEMIVSKTGAFKNHDYVPHIEEVDNSSNFPCGNDDAVVGNRFSKTVGSGGIHLKTTGAMELGGTNMKVGFKKVNINASHGLQIASESYVEIQSLKTITLRTNRQVYIESSLGVKNNLIVGGGVYVEGELFCQHITAPLEVQQTEDTIAYGKFSTTRPRSLKIGEANVDGSWYPVYALPDDDLIINYPHSHHFNNVPLRLAKGNDDVRNIAASERINVHNTVAQSLAQNHERKLPVGSSI